MMSENKNVVGVRFQRAGRVYYFDPADIDLELDDHVVVETERGPAIARVVIAPKQVIASELTEPLKPVLRKTTPEDLRQREAVQQKEEEALSKCKELVDKFDLSMKLLSVDGNLDGSHFTILFSAEGRVDFRRLVRELAQELKARVELHQVGPRDEAKIIGGMGRCGCPLCCVTFLTEFTPLSIKMAKEQNLSLDPTKISGMCGRLLCCLGYETELYRLMKDKLPPVGQAVTTPLGEASVTGVNPLKETVMVQLESQAVVELPLADITVKKRSVRRERKQQ
jgi:cell fate regulator YaaT (PSP1 superfamily)